MKKALRRGLPIALTLILAGSAVGLYYYRNSINQGVEEIASVSATSTSGTLLSQIKQEILTSAPLRSFENVPDSNLTQPGVIALTNQERVSNGVTAVKENSLLDQAAALKLNDMFKNQYFEHVSPSGASPSTLAGDVGYSYVVIGENLALGNFKDDTALLQAWMNSPGHRANILNPQFQDMGAAVGEGMFDGQETWLAVQEFGKPESACPTVDASLKASIDTERTDLDSLQTEIDQKKAALAAEDPETESQRDQYNQDVEAYNALVSEYGTRSNNLKGDIDTYNSEVQAFNACIGQ